MFSLPLLSVMFSDICSHSSSPVSSIKLISCRVEEAKHPGMVKQSRRGPSGCLFRTKKIEFDRRYFWGRKILPIDISASIFDCFMAALTPPDQERAVAATKCEMVGIGEKPLNITTSWVARRSSSAVSGLCRVIRSENIHVCRSNLFIIVCHVRSSIGITDAERDPTPKPHQDVAAEIEWDTKIICNMSSKPMIVFLRTIIHYKRWNWRRNRGKRNWGLNFWENWEVKQPNLFRMWLKNSLYQLPSLF